MEEQDGLEIEFLETKQEHSGIYFLEMLSGKYFQDKFGVDENTLLDHDIEECGSCYYRYISVQIAREMLEKIDPKEALTDIVKRWSNELEKRWQESKYYKLHLDILSGKEPDNAFELRGWIR